MSIRSSDFPLGAADLSSIGSPLPDETTAILTRSRCQEYQLAVDMVTSYAPYAFPIVLEGESGTGKSTLARLVHTLSRRASAEYVEQSLANLSDTLVASELFGHTKGAFTGADQRRTGALQAANGGTIFLDELGHSSPESQAKLLEILDVGRVRPLGSDDAVPIDVRIVFATSISTTELEASGKLLRDLFERIHMYRIQLPNLRQRLVDVPDLIRFFHAKHARGMRLTKPPRLSSEANATLQQAEWPGNVRQLSSAIELLMVHARNEPYITLDHFFGAALSEIAESAKNPRRATPDEIVKTYTALGSAKGASRLLGSSKNTVKAHRKAAAARLPESVVALPPCEGRDVSKSTRADQANLQDRTE